MEKTKEIDHGDPNAKILDHMKNLFWEPVGYKMENCSIGLLASSRALAKLGAFMANKGTFMGKTLMSEETC